MARKRPKPSMMGVAEDAPLLTPPALPPRSVSKTQTAEEEQDWLAAGDAKSGVFNLLSATLGAGQLMLPYAFARAGLVPAVGLLLLGAVATVMSFRLIVLCASERGATSLEQVAREAYGVAMERTVAAGIILFSVSAAVMYLTRASELLEAAFEGSVSQHRALMIYSLFCLVLSVAKQMYTIRTISICSILSVLYLVGLVVGHCLHQVHAHGGIRAYLYRKDVNLFFGSPLGVFQTFPMMVYAFAAQMAVPAILEGMNEEYKLKKRIRRLLEKRTRIARALAIMRAQTTAPEDFYDAFEDAMAEAGRAPSPAPPAALLRVGSQPVIATISPPKARGSLMRRQSSMLQLAGAPLEKISSERFTALMDRASPRAVQKRKKTRPGMNSRQVSNLSMLPLEKLDSGELQALSEMPLERFSQLRMNSAAADPFEALRKSRSRQPRRKRGAVQPAPQRRNFEPQEATLWRLREISREIARHGGPPGSPGSRIAMTANMKVHNFASVATMALTTCVAVDFAIGFFGALEFGVATKSNVLNNFILRFDVDSVFMVLAYTSFLFHISTVFPLILFPCRIAVLAMIFGHEETPFIVDIEQCIVAGTLSEAEENAASGRIFLYHRVSELSSAGFVGLSAIIALQMVPDLKIAFELTRGFAFAFVCFIFPGMAALRMRVQDNRWDIFSAYFIIVVGVVAGALWTWSAILDNGLVQFHPLP